MIIIGEKLDATSQQDLQDDVPPPAYDEIHLSSRPHHQPPSSLNPRLSVRNPSHTSDAASSSKLPYTPPSRSTLSPDSASTSLQHSQSQIVLSSPRPDRNVASSSYYELPTPSTSSSHTAPARPYSTSAQPDGQYAPGQSPLTIRRLIMPGESVTVLLDPPPLSFQRSPAPDLPYPPFEASALMGVSGNLSLAFPLLAPPSSAAPHPFVTHDVNERDWTCFVRDVQAAASLAPTKSLLADVAAPVTSHLPLMGFLLAKGLEMHWKNKRSGPAGELVDYWNHHFFHPRRLHIVLARGAVSFSGADLPPPDRAGSSSLELVSSTKTDDFKNGSPPYDQEERKKTKKAAEKERKKQKKQRKSALSEASEENWRLVVAYYPH